MQIEKRVFGVLVVLVLAVLVGAGCGGDDGDELTTVSLSKAQYIKQADEICQENYEDRTSQLIKYARKAKARETEFSRAEQEEIVSTVILPTFVKDVEGLTQLGVPEGEEEPVEEILTTFEATVQRVEANPGSILAGASRQFGELEKLAGQFGLERCGKS